MEDWYAPDYYSHSPEKNPRGPTSGVYKVMRAKTPWESGIAFCFDRRKERPVPLIEDANENVVLNARGQADKMPPLTNGFRFVVNLEKPMTPTVPHR